MQDFEKSSRVKALCEALISASESYENASNPIYFDYDRVIELLEQAQILALESARCPRPADLPAHMPWCEKLYNSDDIFDPYTFDGTMSIEDYEKMHELMAEDREPLDEDESLGMVME